MLVILRKIKRKIALKFFSIASKKYISRMDQKSFSFSAKEEKELIRLWHLDNSSVPLPTKLRKIFDSQDALLINSEQAATLSFKLPYGIAYEQGQKKAYTFISNWVQQQGIHLEGKTILDAGCGFGGLLATMHEQFPRSNYFGIECVESAKVRLQDSYPWLKVIITNIQQENGNFVGILPVLADVILCTEVLEHLQYPEIAIRNLLTLKKQNGILLLTVPNGRADTAKQHINFWSPESWKIFIEKTCSSFALNFSTIPNVEAPGGFNLCVIVK